MNKSLVKELKAKAEVVADNFSKKNREGNFNNELFKVETAHLFTEDKYRLNL